MEGIVVAVCWELSGRNRCCRMLEFKWEESLLSYTGSLVGGIVVVVWWDLSGRNRCCRMVGFKWKESLLSYGGR